ncbi:MAG: hypothetical protein QW648_03145, partial [Nanoarchaeales archaeon]
KINDLDRLLDELELYTYNNRKYLVNQDLQNKLYFLLKGINTIFKGVSNEEKVIFRYLAKDTFEKMIKHCNKFINDPYYTSTNYRIIIAVCSNIVLNFYGEFNK